MGLFTGAFAGPVKGYDGWGHLSKVQLVLLHFPNVDWNYDWYSGSPFLLGGYPPLFYFAAAALVAVGISASAAMNALMVASYLAMSLSVYGLVRIATGRRAAGLVAALLPLSSPGLWTHLVQAGLYPRVFGMGFVSVSLMLAALYLRKPSLPRFGAMMAAVAGALSSHVILGAIALGVVFLVLLLVPDGAGKSRPLRSVLVIVPLLIVSYYYLPLAFYPQPQSPLSSSYPTVSLSDLFLPGDTFSYALPAILLPLTLLGLIGWFWTREKDSQFATRLMMVCGLVSGALLVYEVFPLPIRVYAVRPIETLFFLSWFLAAGFGLALGSIRLPAGRKWSVGAPAAVGAIALVSIVSGVPTVVNWTVNNPGNPEMVTAGWHPIDPSERSFRVASPSDNLSVWLNGLYDVPQTRGYGAQLQVLNPDQQYWLDNVAWSAATTEEQRTFLLDWYAVGWMYVPSAFMRATAAVIPKLMARPDLYQALPTVNGQPSSTFSYLRRTPIATATNATTVLVIGAGSDYNLVFRDLSYSDLGSAAVIPVRGGPYVDDYSAADLVAFDEIALYGFRFHDQTRAFKLLTDYVRGGGGLIVEASGSPVDLAGGMADPLPVAGTSPLQVQGDWAFTSAASPATDGIKFAAFGEARYNGGPWTVSTATGVKSWARPVLWSGAHPIVVTGQLGQGRVLWSGMNLPYHIDSFQSHEESRFLGAAIMWAARSHSSDSASFSASVYGPEQTTVSVATPARGVLFKESFYANWHAYAGGRELKLYSGGPGFMYVQLPAGVQYPVVVVLRYEKSLLDWIGIALSIATVVSLLAMSVWLKVVVSWAHSAFARLRVRAWVEPND